MKKSYYKYLITLFLTAIFAISAPVFAESSEVRFTRIAAEKGDAEAQYHLALAYDSGDGIELDHEQAVYWYQKAADQGYVDAMFNLAVSYDDGEGVEMDDEMAIYWYTKAAELGDSDAQNNVAVMYEDGEGTDIDYDKARYWYTKSAENKNSLAQYNLADLYYNGRGLSSANKVEAYAWFAVSAENDESGAEERRKGTWRELSKSERADARALADKYIDLYTEYAY